MQPFSEQHHSDADDNPAGGTTSGVGFSIDWQDGPLAGGEPTGAQVEEIIDACVGRLEFFQRSRFRCRENALAVTKLQEARHWLDARTASRKLAGVEGSNEQRDSEGEAA